MNKVHISGIENRLYVSEMEVGKHLLLIPTLTLSFVDADNVTVLGLALHEAQLSSVHVTLKGRFMLL